MLSLRLVRPDLLVDVRRIAELTQVQERDGALVLGAATTHAAIEDGRVPDATRGMLRAVAAGIAYRPVRNRGTIGGSLAHADPAADWPTCLSALGAEALIAGQAGRRVASMEDFLVSAFETTLRSDEILVAVRIPRLSPRARWGFYKVCRKTGEFADAIAAVVDDPERSGPRAAVGATGTAPIIVADAGPLLRRPFDAVAAGRMLRDRGLAGDDIDLQVHVAGLKRAIGRLR
jgi:carbon-monoxide dehydrogenase medium subunit